MDIAFITPGCEVINSWHQDILPRVGDQAYLEFGDKGWYVFTVVNFAWVESELALAICRMNVNDSEPQSLTSEQVLDTILEFASKITEAKAADAADNLVFSR